MNNKQFNKMLEMIAQIIETDKMDARQAAEFVRNLKIKKSDKE